MVIKTLPNEPYEERNGVWEVYDKNGRLEYKTSYKNGQFDGVWEIYHENGKLESKTSYKNDEIIDD